MGTLIDSMKNNKRKRIKEALSILVDLGMPKSQQNERSALSLLAILNLTGNKTWSEAVDPLIGITPIMNWIRKYYGKNYAPNTRETIRRQTMHQFIQAGISVYNPDCPDRPVNSPHAVYQIQPDCLGVIRTFGTTKYNKNLSVFLTDRETLTQKYARHREMKLVPLVLAKGKRVKLSPGKHSELIRGIRVEFASRFIPGGQLVYAGDTGDKQAYFDKELLTSLGVRVDNHGKMPDVVIYYPERDWLILAEAVTSHGPVDGKRHHELKELFMNSNAGLVFLSAFHTRKIFMKYLDVISWETEVWIADTPSHLIHFNGDRFLGPYK